MGGTAQRNPNHQAPNGLSIDTSSFKHPLYVYSFPLTGITIKHTVYNVRYDNDNGVPFVQMLSSTNLTDADAHKRLFISLSLLAIFLERGATSRPISGIGGYWKGVKDEPYNQDKHTAELAPIITALESCSDPFQIQAGFTLSRAYASYSNPETAIIEFFKVIELYIKYHAYNQHLTSASIRAVKQAKLFHPQIRLDLTEKTGLQKNTVDLIWQMKNLRNKLLGHGGVRPFLASYVGDPEQHNATLQQALHDYDPYVKYDETFYEKINYDITVIAHLLFARMCNFQPVYLAVPGCWWQPSGRIMQMIQDEKMHPHMIDPDYLKPINK